MLILFVGSIVVYTYYLKEKKEQLDAIRRGFCPSCHQKGIEITDQRTTGCGGPKMVTFECMECGYTNVFNIGGGSCGI